MNFKKLINFLKSLNLVVTSNGNMQMSVFVGECSILLLYHINIL